MVSLAATEAVVREAIEPFGAQLDIAALNGPELTVVSGDATAIESLGSDFEERGVKVNPLKVSHAFHSAHMDSMLAAFEEVVRTCIFRPAQIPIVSNVTGKLAHGDELMTPEYWVNQVRSAVRFADGMQTLVESGARTFVECGPRGVLSAMGEACLDSGIEAVFVPSLRKGKRELDGFIKALGTLHCLGHDVDWTVFTPGAHATPFRANLSIQRLLLLAGRCRTQCL